MSRPFHNCSRVPCEVFFECFPSPSPVASLAFSVITARLSNDIRNRLYSTILLQDVAFFDGTTTGELTSRLRHVKDESVIAPKQSENIPITLHFSSHHKNFRV